MFLTAEFWVLVAFVLFMGVAGYVGAFSKLLQGLDARGRRIQAELDEAKRLRAEAERVLADYKRRHSEAEAEAAAIVSSARDEAERTTREAHDRLNEFVTRRTAAAEARIAQAEMQAAQQVRAAAADAAVRVSEAVLRDEVSGPNAEAVLARSLAEVKGKLHS